MLENFAEHAADRRLRIGRGVDVETHRPATACIENRDQRELERLFLCRHRERDAAAPGHANSRRRQWRHGFRWWWWNLVGPRRRRWRWLWRRFRARLFDECLLAETLRRKFNDQRREPLGIFPHELRRSGAGEAQIFENKIADKQIIGPAKRNAKLRRMPRPDCSQQTPKIDLCRDANGADFIKCSGSYEPAFFCSPCVR